MSHLADLRRTAQRRRWTLIATVTILLGAGFVLTLMLGQSLTPLGDVLRVLSGQDVPGASFTVGELRLPRAMLAILAGFCFGMGGAAFQTMLRNPLASPDIIGISFGASAAAVFAILVLGMDGTAVSAVAVASGLGIAMLIYALSWRGGAAGTRLILVGIGISAMLESIIAYIFLRAPAFDAQEALRWLTGSLNGAQIGQSALVFLALAVFGTLLIGQRRNLEALRLGDDTAAALGVAVGWTRVIVIVSAVGLIAFATAATGPIAFVSFLAGPIAARITGSGRSLLIPAGLVGAALVLLGDYAGQFLLPGRYPVGVVTGVLGAPYLLYLIIRESRGGAA